MHTASKYPKVQTVLLNGRDLLLELNVPNMLLLPDHTMSEVCHIASGKIIIYEVDHCSRVSSTRSLNFNWALASQVM